MSFNACDDRRGRVLVGSALEQLRSMPVRAGIARPLEDQLRAVQRAVERPCSSWDAADAIGYAMGCTVSPVDGMSLQRRVKVGGRRRPAGPP